MNGASTVHAGAGAATAASAYQKQPDSQRDGGGDEDAGFEGVPDHGAESDAGHSLSFRGEWTGTGAGVIGLFGFATSGEGSSGRFPAGQKETSN
jgi:hypothetical protein